MNYRNGREAKVGDPVIYPTMGKMIACRVTGLREADECLILDEWCHVKETGETGTLAMYSKNVIHAEDAWNSFLLCESAARAVAQKSHP